MLENRRDRGTDKSQILARRCAGWRAGWREIVSEPGNEVQCSLVALSLLNLVDDLFRLLLDGAYFGQEPGCFDKWLLMRDTRQEPTRTARDLLDLVAQP